MKLPGPCRPMSTNSATEIGKMVSSALCCGT